MAAKQQRLKISDETKNKGHVLAPDGGNGIFQDP